MWACLLFLLPLHGTSSWLYRQEGKWKTFVTGDQCNSRSENINHSYPPGDSEIKLVVCIALPEELYFIYMNFIIWNFIYETFIYELYYIWKTHIFTMNFEVPPAVKIMSALSKNVYQEMHLGEKQNRIHYIHSLFYKQVIQKFSEVEQLNFLNEYWIYFSPL